MLDENRGSAHNRQAVLGLVSLLQHVSRFGDVSHGLNSLSGCCGIYRASVAMYSSTEKKASRTYTDCCRSGALAAAAAGSSGGQPALRVLLLACARSRCQVHRLGTLHGGGTIRRGVTLTVLQHFVPCSCFGSVMQCVWNSGTAAPVTMMQCLSHLDTNNLIQALGGSLWQGKLGTEWMDCVEQDTARPSSIGRQPVGGDVC